MVNIKGTKYEDFEAELLRKPGIRREYEALRPKYEMIQSLIERRNELHLSQLQLANIVGMQQPTISRLESGRVDTTIGTLFKVVHALKLNVELKPRSPVKG